MSRGDDALVVAAAGPLSTIQDAGRWGHLRNGVPPAGAMDMIALAAANLLVGNAPGAAAIEFTLAGDTLECAAESARATSTGSERTTGSASRRARSASRSARAAKAAEAAAAAMGGGARERDALTVA